MAATYYIDPLAGNDGNPGTEALPWQTLAWAIATMAATDSLRMAAGTYVAAGLAWAKNSMSFEGWPETLAPEDVVWDGGGAAVICAAYQTASFKRMTFTGWTTTAVQPTTNRTLYFEDVLFTAGVGQCAIFLGDGSTLTRVRVTNTTGGGLNASIQGGVNKDVAVVSLEVADTTSLALYLSGASTAKHVTVARSMAGGAGYVIRCPDLDEVSVLDSEGAGLIYSDGVRARCNAWNNTSGGDLYAGAAVDTDCTSVDPLELPDLSPSADSPLVGAGNPAEVGLFDVTGRAFRPLPAIGARELLATYQISRVVVLGEERVAVQIDAEGAGWPEVAYGPYVWDIAGTGDVPIVSAVSTLDGASVDWIELLFDRSMNDRGSYTLTPGFEGPGGSIAAVPFDGPHVRHAEMKGAVPTDRKFIYGNTGAGFQKDARGDYARASRLDAIKAMVYSYLTTRVGELAEAPTYGLLAGHKDIGNQQARERVRVAVSELTQIAGVRGARAEIEVAARNVRVKVYLTTEVGQDIVEVPL